VCQAADGGALRQLHGAVLGAGDAGQVVDAKPLLQGGQLGFAQEQPGDRRGRCRLLVWLGRRGIVAAAKAAVGLAVRASGSWEWGHQLSSFRIESARPPRGDPMALWSALAASFAKGHRDYHQIHLGRGRYHGMSAAVWEFTHAQGGRSLRKIDVTFTSPSGQWGYAVLFTAPADLWASSQGLVRDFEQGFTPLE
jgi:hypothetical protein